MSVIDDTPYQPCAICGEAVLTDDTDRVRYDEDGTLGVQGPMHIGCYEGACEEAATEVEAPEFFRDPTFGYLNDHYGY